MVSAVVFDMDGVIVDSVWINTKAAEMTFSEVGITLTKEDREIVAGRHPADFLPILQERYPLDPENMMEREEVHYFSLFEKIEAFPRTLQLLRELQERNIPLALSTSSSRRSVDIVLKKFGLEDVFRAVVTFEDCENRKPAPDSYVLAAQRLGIPAKDCLVIEDTRVGVQAAKAAGMKCVALPNRHTEHQDFREADRIMLPNEELSASELLLM